MQRFSNAEALLFFLIQAKRRNSMSSIQYMSKETMELMKKELHRLKSVERPAASKAIGEAREKGDLKENAEYDAAKEAQGLLEAKISLLDSQIANARILDESTLDLSKVSIMTKVTLTNIRTGKQFTYQIVSEPEADLKLSKISFSSPIGKGVLGKKVGEIVDVQAPAGVIQFKIENISL